MAHDEDWARDRERSCTMPRTPRRGTLTRCPTTATVAGERARPGPQRDLVSEPAWPTFGPAARGLERALSAVDRTAHTTSRADEDRRAHLYSREPNGFTDGDQHVALLLATHASLALTHAETVELAALKETNLQRAIDSRDVIGMVKGILMQRQGIDAAAAFDRLRDRAQQSDRVALSPNIGVMTLL